MSINALKWQKRSIWIDACVCNLYVHTQIVLVDSKAINEDEDCSQWSTSEATSFWCLHAFLEPLTTTNTVTVHHGAG